MPNTNNKDDFYKKLAEKYKANKENVSSGKTISSGSLTLDSFMRGTNKLTSYNHNLNLSDREKEELEHLDLRASHHLTEKELNEAKADAQSFWSKVSGFGWQTANEIGYGTIEAFSNIADGVINTFTGDSYGRNFITEWTNEKKEEIKARHPIFLKDPNKSFAFNDVGWYLQGMADLSTIVSLGMGAAGWAKIGKYAANVTKFNKAGKLITRGISRGLAKTAETALPYGALRNIATKSARIESTILQGAPIVSQAVISRAGENYMEANSIYLDTYENVKERLNTMSDEDFVRLQTENEEFQGLTRDEVAKEIARQSANKTFYLDYLMLLMDIPQLKGLGTLWGKNIKQGSKAAERIAAKNLKATFAGVNEKDLIKDTFINRRLDDVKFALKAPLKSAITLDISEGIEEMYQGIASEKGMEVAEQYLDPAFTSKTFGNYLSDLSIWEQGFWGFFGGEVYKHMQKGFEKGSRAIEAKRNKKHMTPEEYEAWKASDDKIVVQQIQSIKGIAEEFVQNMNTLSEGKNPYKFRIDEATGRKLIIDGNIQEESISENQKDLLKRETVRKFVDDITLDAIDRGNYDLIESIINSKEFDGYLSREVKGFNPNTDKLSEDIVQRMKNVKDVYYTALHNVNDFADTTNPYITIAAARSVARNKLQSLEYEDQLLNIDTAISHEEKNIQHYQTYIDEKIYNEIQRHLANLVALQNRYKDIYDKGGMSRYVYDMHIRDINEKTKKLYEVAASLTTKGLLDTVIEESKLYTTAETIETFSKIIDKIDTSKKVTPPNRLMKYINDKIDVSIKKAYTDSYIPKSNKDYQNIYDDFSIGMDKMREERIKDYMGSIEKYLLNSENFDEALGKLLRGEVNSKLRDAITYIRYGYAPINSNNNNILAQSLINTQFNTMVQDIRKKHAEAKQRRQDIENDLGIKPPSDEELEQNNSDNTDDVGRRVPKDETSNDEVSNDDTDYTSTGEETFGEQIIIDENSANIYGNDTENLTEQQKTELDKQLDQDESIINKVELEVARYIAIVNGKQQGIIKELVTAFENGDNSKFNEFINKIVKYLEEKGYDPKIAKHVAHKQAIASINNFGNNDSDSYIAKLAKQIAANGVSDKVSENYAETELLDGKGQDETIEEFLDEYSKLTNNDKLPNGKTVINLQSLFNYLLTEEDVDIRVASYIYDNIGKFIAKHDGSTYIFTGFGSKNNNLTSEQFFNRLNENKAYAKEAIDKMHIQPVEPEKRDKHYEDALKAIHNGQAKPYIKLEGVKRENGNVALDENKKPINTYIGIYVDYTNPRTKKTSTIKIGILRVVKTNSDLTTISPVSHNSGFANKIIKQDGNITLDCEFLFNALINDKDSNPEAQQLFEDLAQYFVTTQDISDRQQAGIISDKEAKKELDKAMPKEMVDRILKNKLIVELLNKEAYKFDETKDTDKKKAIAIAESISSILFYGHYFSSTNPVNYNLNDMAIDSYTMTQRFEEWKNKVYYNYINTHNIQKSIKSNEETVYININVGYYTLLNTIKDPNKYQNIKDVGFEMDPTSDDYNPLVIVTPDKKLIDEYGNDYGYADSSIGAYSMGYLVHNKDGVKYIAYFNRAQDISDSDLMSDVKTELESLIIKQFNNVNDDNHETVYEEIVNKLSEIFARKGMFNTSVYGHSDDNHTHFALMRDKKPILTFWKTNDNGTTNSNAVTIKLNGKIYNIKSINGNTNLIKQVISELTKDMTLNKSMSVMKNKTTTGGKSVLFDRINGKFVINLGGKQHVYESYGDFLLKNGGFNTNVTRKDGSFVSGAVKENHLTIDVKVVDNAELETSDGATVSDLLFGKTNKNRKTIDTVDVLRAAKVDEDKIKILTGEDNSINIITKKIKISDREDSYMYYDVASNSIYITSKGAKAMDENSTNAVRLILHENLHRLFHNKGVYNKEQKNRIIKDLREVYDYTRSQLLRDKNSGRISNGTYNQIISVLDKATGYATEETNMEEFLMESLTQPLLVEYLNSTKYHTEVIIDGISNKKKSIFQKIIDILLNLFGINQNNIKNNSILAKEYLILSKTVNTAPNLFTSNIIQDNTTSPVEEQPQPTTNQDKGLVKTKNEIDNIIQDFKDRITRSPNFKEDHKYYIDGVPVDYSVTQKVHGETNIGDWGTPASLLGNTADEAARIYFDNDGKLPDGYIIPNTVTEEDYGVGYKDPNSNLAFIKELDKIKEYLDNKFGKGNYGVLTQEFPIGGVIEVNGEKKTIAGTMDMLVYTNTGDIYIYDFKTKRIGESDGNFNEETLHGYTQQLNIYRQLLTAQYPHLIGRIKIGGLIKFNVDYPAPSDKVQYRQNPNKENQLQINTGNGFVDIQDATIDYTAPYLEDINDKNTIVPIETVDYGDPIYALPEENENDEPMAAELSVDDYSVYMDEDFNENPDEFLAVTELIVDKSKTPIEVRTENINDNNADNPFGVTVVNDLSEFVNSFPIQYRESIKQILAENELNYTCE